MTTEHGTPPDPKPDSPDRPSAAGAAAASAAVQRATDAVMRFDFPIRLLLLGSGATLLLGFFSWYRISMPFATVAHDGFAGAGWIFGITSAATVALLVVPTLKETVLRGVTRKNTKLVFFGLALGTLVFGPLRVFFGGGGEVMANMPSEANDMISGGKTFWFWLAFLASGTAVAGAYLSLREEVTADSSPAASS